MHEFKCEDALEMERELELFWPSVDLDSWLADLQIFGHTHTHHKFTCVTLETTATLVPKPG